MTAVIETTTGGSGTTTVAETMTAAEITTGIGITTGTMTGAGTTGGVVLPGAGAHEQPPIDYPDRQSDLQVFAQRYNNEGDEFFYGGNTGRAALDRDRNLSPSRSVPRFSARIHGSKVQGSCDL